MGFKKSLKALALASSLFLSVNLASCAIPYVVKHRSGDVYQQVKKPKNRYAILVSGTYSSDYFERELQEKALEVYVGLKELGFSDENIYFLVTYKSDAMEGIADHLFTNHHFRAVCSELSDKITEDDLLLFYYVGHGGEEDNRYSLLKGSNDPSDSEEGVGFYAGDLEYGLKDLKYGYAVLVIDSCMSGGFAKPLGKKNRVSVSTTCETQLNWIVSKFTPNLIDALKGKEDADKDKDGKVSLEEAVEYASENDPWSGTSILGKIFCPQPQMYYEDVDPSKIFLKE